jgi:hypothetical protein
LDAPARVVVDPAVALERQERRHAGLALALRRRDGRVSRRVQARRAEHEPLGLPVHDLGLLARRCRDGHGCERPELAVVEGEAGQQRRLRVGLGHDEPDFRYPGEQVVDELLLEVLGMPRLAGVEDEVGRPMTEMGQRERHEGRGSPLPLRTSLYGRSTGA